MKKPLSTAQRKALYWMGKISRQVPANYTHCLDDLAVKECAMKLGVLPELTVPTKGGTSWTYICLNDKLMVFTKFKGFDDPADNGYASFGFELGPFRKHPNGLFLLVKLLQSMFEAHGIDFFAAKFGFIENWNN